MVRIVEARPLPAYRLALRFSDGSAGEVDLAAHAGKGVSSPWSDPAEFANVHVDTASSTVAWRVSRTIGADAIKGGGLSVSRHH